MWDSNQCHFFFYVKRRSLIKLAYHWKGSQFLSEYNPNAFVAVEILFFSHDRGLNDKNDQLKNGCFSIGALNPRDKF